ncbi:hypothetical protein B0H66DRAFT_576468 [Apodospora peruviana]|uniref:F-box domain-containing protein n=1 Tax=Apodospora peruviana TaxID=516989 RepID=A0AAE0I151_9PEZI|nr:hypothetical protein B0H66DRAFT_576468 [Apodospora peruviana]
MIEVLYSTSALQATGPVFTREEHKIKELSLLRGGKRAPRRSQTHQNYLLPQPSSVVTIHTLRQQPRVVENGLLQLTGSTPDLSQPKPNVENQITRRRPALGPPRRSYSVTDQEPLPHHHRPSSRLSLVDLPAELHFAIFDFLDPIDSTCLGLTNRHFYAIHRRMRGTVPLSTRRDGPNELEWAWHLAGAVLKASSGLDATGAVMATSPDKLGEKQKNALSKLRIRGQAYCRKCGVTRCELHKHIQEWMGEEAEYCSIKQKFGPAAREGAKPYCYMSKPGDPHRCGRHFVRKSKVILQ